jgi:aspartyl-tRNA(Asn)/glutamyl-tRNA(Gln) amidotransferase subunit A
VPTGLDKRGLPLGLQLIGRPWEEGELLNTAYALEQAAGFVAKPGEMVVRGPKERKRG